MYLNMGHLYPCTHMYGPMETMRLAKSIIKDSSNFIIKFRLDLNQHLATLNASM